MQQPSSRASVLKNGAASFITSGSIAREVSHKDEGVLVGASLVERIAALAEAAQTTWVLDAPLCAPADEGAARGLGLGGRLTEPSVA